MASFAVAAALLLYALQFSALALGFGATPEQRLEYFPKSSISDKVLAKVRKDQWSEMWLRAAYGKRAALWPRWLLPTRDQVPASKRPHHLADEGQAVLFGPSPEVKDLLQRLDRLIVALETGRQPPKPPSAGEAAKAQDGAPPVRTGPEHSGSDLPTVRRSRP